MDYLEGKIESFQATQGNFDAEKAKLLQKLETTQDKYALFKDAKEREINSLNKKLTDAITKAKTLKEKTLLLEERISQFEKEQGGNSN